MKIVIFSILSVLASQFANMSAAEDANRTIFGFVMELRSGTPDVQVFLCDGKTGMPLTKDFVSFFDEAALKKRERRIAREIWRLSKRTRRDVFASRMFPMGLIESSR